MCSAGPPVDVFRTNTDADNSPTVCHPNETNHHPQENLRAHIVLTSMVCDTHLVANSDASAYSQSNSRTVGASKSLAQSLDRTEQGHNAANTDAHG